MRKDLCVVFIHGMYANVIENYFAVVWGKELAECNIGFLYGHTRGYSNTNDILDKNGDSVTMGTTYEIFEECLLDIDMWIKKAYELGYRRIIVPDRNGKIFYTSIASLSHLSKGFRVVARN